MSLNCLTETLVSVESPSTRVAHMVELTMSFQLPKLKLYSRDDELYGPGLGAHRCMVTNESNPWMVTRGLESSQWNL